MNREQEVAWAAGLFEGEGTFGFRKLVRGGHAPADLRLGMVDRDVVEEFARIVGCGSIRTQARRRPHQDIHIWIVSGMDSMRKVIELIRPYLRERRGNVADRALSYINDGTRNRRELRLGGRCVNGHDMTEQTLVVQERWPNYCRICRKAARDRYEAKQR